MVMTEEYAAKYFGEADPIGQRVTMESDTGTVTVTGVVENVPDNSHVKFDMLASLSSYPQMAKNQFWIPITSIPILRWPMGLRRKNCRQSFRRW